MSKDIHNLQIDLKTAAQHWQGQHFVVAVVVQIQRFNEEEAVGIVAAVLRRCLQCLISCCKRT